MGWLLLFPGEGASGPPDVKFCERHKYGGGSAEIQATRANQEVYMKCMDLCT